METPRPVFFFLRNVKESFVCIWHRAILAFICNFHLGHILLKEHSSVTDKVDNTAKLDWQSIPVSYPKVGGSGRRGGLEAGHPVAGGKFMSWRPGLVPLAHHALLLSNTDPSLVELSGISAGVGQVGHVVARQVGAGPAGVGQVIGGPLQVRVGEAVDEDGAIICWDGVLLMTRHIWRFLCALNVCNGNN